MTKLQEIEELEKKIEIIKEELQTENKEKLQKLSNDFNFYYPLDDGEMELNTEIISSMNSDKIQYTVESSYIKVSEYFYYLENNPNPLETKIKNRIKELKDSREKTIKSKELIIDYEGEEQYYIEIDTFDTKINTLEKLL